MNEWIQYNTIKPAKGSENRFRHELQLQPTDELTDMRESNEKNNEEKSKNQIITTHKTN